MKTMHYQDRSLVANYGLGLQAALCFSGKKAKRYSIGGCLFFFLLSANISMAQTPTNDECANATVIQPDMAAKSCTKIYTASTLNATQSKPAPSCTSSLNDDDIWYRFTATEPGIIIRIQNVHNTATGGNTVMGMSVYEGCPTGTSSLYCSNIASGGTGRIVLDHLVVGNDYLIRFWSVLASGYASFEFCTQAIPQPANDECTGAINLVTEPNGSICDSKYSASTVGASASQNPAACADIFQDDDIWFRFTANGSAVRVNYSNVENAFAGSGSLNLGFALYEDDCSALSLHECNPNIGNNSGSALIGGLTAGASYLLRLFTYGNGDYANFDFCVVDVDVPINDECAYANIMNVQFFPAPLPYTGTLFNATATDNMIPPQCVPGSGANDVWFGMYAPASGSFTVQTLVTDPGSRDLIIEAYRGSCQALSYITCDDDSNPDDFPSDLGARISISGLAPYEFIYFRVLGKYANNNGPFAILGWDNEDSLAIAPATNCQSLLFPYLPATSQLGNTYWWNPIVDVDTNLVAEINPRGQERNFFTELSNSSIPLSQPFYLERHLSITSSSATDSIDIAFYFTETEWQDLRSAVSSLTDPAQLVVYLTGPGCGPMSASPTDVIIPKSVSRYKTGYRLQFRSPPGHAFYFGAPQESPLPVTWGNIQYACTTAGVELQWETLTENNVARFIIERSADQIQYEQIGEIQAYGNNSTPQRYRYTDGGTEERSFYRIKEVDFDNHISFSKVLATTCRSVDFVRIYPNPAKDRSLIRWSSSSNINFVQLCDQWGRVVFETSVNSGLQTFEIDLSILSVGVYIVNVGSTSEGFTHRLLLVKQE